MKENVKMEMKSNIGFAHETVGLKELRQNISEFFHFTVYNFKEIIIGNAKKGGKTATIISTDILNEILESFKFNTTISFDDATKQFEVLIPEISANGCGDTKEEAIAMAIDNVLDLMDDYYENIELYERIENMKKQHPYFIRIRNCNSKEDLSKVLNLQ